LVYGFGIVDAVDAAVVDCDGVDSEGFDVVAGVGVDFEAVVFDEAAAVVALRTGYLVGLAFVGMEAI
jgi:hypothetical protein